MPDPEELDRLFLTERLQLSRFRGLRTWEAQIFTEHAQLGAADKQPLVNVRPDPNWFLRAFGEAMIQRNPSHFLEIFRESHWLGINKAILDDVPKAEGVNDTDRWNTKCLPLWNQIVVCIDLADRILGLACETKW
jgi:hypothetical protein